MVADARTTRTVLDRPTLVLNRSWFPIHVTTVRRALCLTYREVAQVVDPLSLQTHGLWDWIEATSEEEPAGEAPNVRSSEQAFTVPEVILLLVYDKVPTYEAPFSRRNLYQRDGFTCQYCGKRFPADRLSIDHVRPRSRGGPTTWDNCVLACVRCNSLKGNRSPADSGLRLLRKPRAPRWTPYLNLRRSEWLPSWRQFVAGLGDRSATGT